MRKAGQVLAWVLVVAGVIVFCVLAPQRQIDYVILGVTLINLVLFGVLLCKIGRWL